MRPIKSLIVLLGLMLMPILALQAQETFSVVYGSGIHDANLASILVPAVPDAEVLYFSGNAVTSYPMPEYYPFPVWNTATLPVPDHPYLGFRKSAQGLLVNPIFYNQTSAPPVNLYTPLETDPTGDQAFTNNSLDILSTAVSFSQDKLYFAIKCNATTYPVSSGISTYFSYMAVLVDPDALPEDDPIVYGLMHTVNLGAIISPGLYKITGTGFNDLTRIGDIAQSVDPSTSSLLLSCNLADLMADTDFAAWYNPDYPRLTTTAITSRITLTGGTEQADVTEGGKILLLPQLLPIQNDAEPQLSDAHAEVTNTVDGPVLVAGITYMDTDANFPRDASFSLDSSDYMPLQLSPGQTPDFTSPVAFTSGQIPVTSTWEEITFRFSSGDGYVYHTIQNEVPVSDEYAGYQVPNLSLYPNPVKSLLNVDVKDIMVPDGMLEIFNIRGQRIAVQKASANTNRIDVAGLQAGVYFLRFTNRDGFVTRRFLIAN
jgi:hypothetical protein